MKVITQLRLMAIVLFSFASLNVVLVYVQIDKMASDGRVVNFAGIVRGGSQRLVKKELTGHPDDELIEKLSGIINGLIKGDKKLNLPRATSPEFVDNLKETEKSWIQLKQRIIQARENPQLREEVYKLSEDYFELTNKAVFAAEEAGKENVNVLKTLQIVLFIFNLILIAGIWIVARNTSARLKQTISAIATSAAEIATTVEQQERITTQQAAAVNQTTTTMDELSASSQQSAKQAEAAGTGASQALNLAQSGTQTVEQTLKGMFNLKEKVGAIQAQILLLNQQTNQIGNISNLVSDIANQTNVLALNASIEAVRAGEHGKGFGVVATEIRKLAAQSKKLASQINALVADIENAINSTVKVTEEGTHTVNAGMKLTQSTAQAFTGVTDSINSIVINSQQISLSAQQQALAIQQVMDAMNALNQGAVQTSSGISETKVGTQKLNEAAQDLKSVV